MPFVTAVVATVAGLWREQAFLGPKAPGAAEAELAFFLRLRGESQNIKLDTVFHWMTEARWHLQSSPPTASKDAYLVKQGAMLSFSSTPRRIACPM